MTSNVISNRTRTGYLIGWISIAINVILFAFKYYVGQKSGSVAMQADAWHTLSDSLTSIVVIIGFWLASRPPDRNHPFGHGRAESIGAIIVAVMLALVGVNFFLESVYRIRNVTLPEYNHFAIIVFLISVVLKELLAQISIIIGKKINSPALVADGWHHRSDALASGVIVLGAIYGTALWWFDGTMGLIVALLILHSAYVVFKTSANNLLGTSIPEEMDKLIRLTAHQINPQITDIHNINLHSYGEHKELTLHIRLPEDMTVKESHNIASNIENQLSILYSMNTTVHIEPSKTMFEN